LYELIKPINSKYDIPVKVALSKSLKFLIVDTPQSAEYCTDFLKEKGLFKDLVVLQNVPEKQHNQGIKRLIGNQGELIYEVIEVSRKHANLDKAVRYFLGDKVVCKDFDLAVKLQGLGVKDIVTEDGTEFKQGMISGGVHQNIFNLNFGVFKLDSEWRKLFEVIKKLDEELQVLRQQEKEDDYAHEQ
jgi:chromosome segregation ATPase